MDIGLQADGSGIRLSDPDEFTKFAVSIMGISEAQWRSKERHREDLESVVGDVEVGPEGSYAWVPIDLVVSLAGKNKADEADRLWFQSLASMVQYANSHGWLRDQCIRAHITFAQSRSG